MAGMIGRMLNEVGREFEFRPGVTPMSDAVVPLSTVFGYFIFIHFLQKRMETKKAFELRPVLVAHNGFLCVASTMLFTWLVAVLVQKFINSGYNVDFMICSEKMHSDGRVQLIYFLNYLTKYYELLDTVLLVLRKKPVVFLHEYHHGATLLLTWVQQREHSTVQWVPIVCNLGVHIAMYYYYTLSALKIHVWWKKHLTTMQIIQFVVGVGASSYCYGIYIMNGMDHSKCNGTDLGAVTGIGILISYLILFVQFYFKTYRKPRDKGAKAN